MLFVFSYTNTIDFKFASNNIFYMKIYFLGTNGWHDTETGETPCILIDSKEAYIILDAGNALRKIDRFIEDPKKPVYLFLSHFHLDHTSGLHILLKFAFPQGITIFGQPGTIKTLNTLIERPFTASIEMINKKMRLDIKELKEGKNKIDNIELETAYLIHVDPCFGYSFAIEGKKITYCTDTGVCDAIYRLAKNSDLLVTECAWKDRNQYKNWPHLAPEDAAETAKKANAKQLILTHFDALNYQSLDQRKQAEVRARKIFPKTIAANDDFEFSI